MLLMKIFSTISLKILAIAPQKLVSRVLLSYESLHNSCDNFYDEIVMMFVHEHDCKALNKKVEGKDFI